MARTENIAGIVIRDAAPSEYDAIRALTLEAYAEYATLLAPPFWQGYSSQMVHTLDEDRKAERIVAVRDQSLLGSVLLFPAETSVYGNAVGTQNDPEVRLLAVSPQARGMGIGELLMQECQHRAKLAGAKVLSLHTMDFMQSAVRLYTRLGFTRAPETDFQPAPGFVVKGFRLSLNEMGEHGTH